MRTLKITILAAVWMSISGVALPAVPALAAGSTTMAAGRFADASVCPTSPNGNGCGLPQVDASTDSGGALQTILRIIFGIIGAFALLSITLSGLKYITAAGNPQKTSEAKSGVIYALVGLMLAITAEAIVAFVVNRGSP